MPVSHRRIPSTSRLRARHFRAAWSSCVRATRGGAIRCGLPLAWVVVAALGILGPASAQEDGETASPRSTPSLSLFDRLDFHPRYDSRYTVNRTSIGWTQGLNMDRDFGPLSASNRWSVNIQRNETQNNRRQQDGRSSSSLAYNAEGAGGWSIGTDLGVNRRFLTSDFNRTVDNSTDVDLVTTTGVLGHAIRQRLEADEDALDWSLTGAWGVTRATQINETRSRTDGSVSRADSTGTEGTARRLETTLALDPDASWDIELGGYAWRGASDARTQQFNADSLITADNRSWENRFNVSGSWTPMKNTVLTFGGKVQRSRRQDYNRIIQAQDTVTGVDESARLSLDARPLWGIRSVVTFSAGALRSDYRVQDSDRTSSNEGILATFDFSTGKIFGFMAGTDVKLEWEMESGRTTFSEDRTQHYDSDKTRMKVDLSRPIGTKLSATVGGEALLTQRFYEDGDQDDDDLRTWFDAALKYDLSSRVDATLNIRWNGKEIVKVQSSQSANSTTDTDLRVGANYNWRIVDRVTFGQRYSVFAQSKELAFRDQESQLSRTSEVVSTLTSQVGERVDLDLEHKFSFRDSGRFSIDPASGVRAYGKDREEDWQYLEVGTRYHILRGLADLHARQRFEVRESRVLTSGQVTNRPKTELTWGTQFKHDIAEGFDLSGLIDRISSTQEPSYWLATVSLNRVF